MWYVVYFDVNSHEAREAAVAITGPDSRCRPPRSPACAHSRVEPRHAGPGRACGQAGGRRALPTCHGHAAERARPTRPARARATPDVGPPGDTGAAPADADR